MDWEHKIETHLEASEIILLLVSSDFMLHVIPMHYGTFPLLTGTPAALREALLKLGLDQVEVIEMQPGQTI
jgi:hypothetical protein